MGSLSREALLRTDKGGGVTPAGQSRTPPDEAMAASGSNSEGGVGGRSKGLDERPVGIIWEGGTSSQCGEKGRYELGAKPLACGQRKALVH